MLEDAGIVNTATVLGKTANDTDGGRRVVV
jgi:hypothetical protein